MKVSFFKEKTVVVVKKLRDIFKFFLLSSLILSVGFVGGWVFVDGFRATTKVQQVSKTEKEDQELGEFVLILMDITKAKLAEWDRQHIAQTIVRVTRNILADVDSRKTFAVLVAIESKFDKNARSPVGAVGLAQLMERYVKDFGQPCGIVDFKTTDITDVELNLTLGACHFKQLLVVLNNTALALVAYNAGQSSESLKQMKSLANIQNTETANYVSKFTYLKDMAEKEQTK